jgi:hypothetical protein
MAERRMFAKTIIDSDAFLEMPTSSQLLYFHLSMRADDDGFVNKPKSVMRMVGCKEDDLKLLFVKKFLIPFESGIVVIKHWKIHNYIAKDRYTETKYKEEKSMLQLDENKAYTQSNTPCIQDVDESMTQVRLGKVSLGKVSEDNISAPDEAESAPPKKKKPTKHKYGEFQNVLLTDPEYEKLADDFGADLRDKAISFLDAYIEEKGYKSKSHNLAIRRWVMDAVKENESKQPKTGGRKEKLPSWYVKPYEHSAAEMDNIRRLLAENESPEAQAEREQLAKDLQAFGRSG